MCYQQRNDTHAMIKLKYINRHKVSIFAKYYRNQTKMANTYRSKVWHLKNYFHGEPKLSDFRLEEYVLPALKNGELICKAEYLSVDPYMRKYMSRYPEGSAMICTQVARVVESMNSKYPIDSYIYGHFGWRTYSLIDPDDANVPIKPYSCPNFGNYPISYFLGCWGRPGNSAYFGVLELLKPKEGETMVISGAAGAVGCLVGQIGKIKGCKVVGIAGSDEKCNWLKDELGFDDVINYKTADIPEELKRICPEGVDTYFDNVGGMISYYVIKQMNNYGRIAVCGAISSYNNEVDDLPRVPQITDFHRRFLRMEGFLVNRWLGDRWFEGINQIYEWVKEGKIKYKETITDGFENMPQAFIEMLNGKNFGKAIVKITD